MSPKWKQKKLSLKTTQSPKKRTQKKVPKWLFRIISFLFELIRTVLVSNHMIWWKREIAMFFKLSESKFGKKFVCAGWISFNRYFCQKRHQITCIAELILWICYLNQYSQNCVFQTEEISSGKKDKKLNSNWNFSRKIFFLKFRINVNANINLLSSK